MKSKTSLANPSKQRRQNNLPMRTLPISLRLPLLILFVLVGACRPAVIGAAEFDAAAALERAFQVPDEFQDDYGDYASVLRFADGRPVRTAVDWRLRRVEILDRWHELMGSWPPLVEDHKLEIIETRRRENFVQKKIRFQWTPPEMTEGYLLIPDGQGKRPAVLTVYYEPETAIGEGKELRDFAYQLARRGFVTLSIGTARTTQNRTYANYWPNREDAQVQPLSMLGCVAANVWNLLAKQPEVDSSRIGIVGHSYGGKWAMFASCLFDKFACAAWSDPGIVFDDTRSSVNYWEPWYLGYEPPPWRNRGLVTGANPATGLYPRLRKQGMDLHELHALMAPRPFLVSGGSEDPPRRWRALNRSIEVNRLLGVKDRVAMTNRPKHSPTPESNAVIYSFFEKFLME
jgi:dienelactone hydrolase